MPLDLSEAATTPGRVTSIDVDVPTYINSRTPIHVARPGDQINVASYIGRSSTNVQFLADRTWALKRKYQGWENAALASGTFVTDSDGSKIPNAVVYYGMRGPFDLPGSGGWGIGGLIGALAMPVFGRIVLPGDNWSQTLAADEAALNRPTLNAETVPLNRVFSGSVTYAANRGFVFVFMVPAGVSAQDWLFTYYFGGPSEATAVEGFENTLQGMWAVSFRGDGTAVLYGNGYAEGLGADYWTVRKSFRYSAPTRAVNGWHWCSIQPLGRNKIIFTNTQADNHPKAEDNVWGDVVHGGRKLPVNTVIHTHSAASTKHTFNTHIAGAGTVRVDARADMRWYFSIGLDGWETSGTLYDTPFTLPRIVPAGTELEVVGDYETPAGTTLTIAAYRADTGAALTVVPGETSKFYTAADVREYFLKFTFTGPGTATPLLRGYTVIVDHQIVLTAPTTQTGGEVQTVSVLGPTRDPSTETARLLIDDPGGELTKLAQRGRTPVQIKVTQDESVSILFDGEVARAGSGKKQPERRNAADAWPVDDWRVYDCLLVGKWARLYDKVALQPQDYSQDFTEPADSSGRRPPWKVSDIIADLFGRAGVPTEQLDIPDNEQRLFPGPNSPPLRLPLPNTRYAPLIFELARLYLDWFICWDANAGTRGKWRAFPAPQQPYATSFVWDFVFGPQAGEDAGPVHVPQRYNSEQTWIVKNSYQTWVEAPEANWVQVWGVGEKEGDTQYRVYAELRNFRSYDPDADAPTADPTHRDHLGYELPLIYPDPTIRSQDAADFICRRLYDAVAYGKEWASWRSPLVLLSNPADILQTNPRPLRLGDVVRLDSRFAMIRSASAEIDRSRGGDLFQWGDYTAVFLDDPL